jgi:hypothetical protein
MDKLLKFHPDQLLKRKPSSSGDRITSPEVKSSMEVSISRLAFPSEINF